MYSLHTLKSSLVLDTHKISTTMAARFTTSTAIRGALAAHASISATSVLCSVLGRPSQLSVDPENSSQQKHDTSSRNNISTDTDVLPWLEQLHNLVASIYVNGGVNHQCFTATSSHHQNNSNQNNNVTMVKIGKDISLVGLYLILVYQRLTGHLKVGYSYIQKVI